MDTAPLVEIFTVDSTCFPLDPDPSALPDCLIQMAVNQVFIPLSMPVTLNNIETNQVVKYKWITYSSGIGKLSWTRLLSLMKISSATLNSGKLNQLVHPDQDCFGSYSGTGVAPPPQMHGLRQRICGMGTGMVLP